MSCKIETFGKFDCPKSTSRKRNDINPPGGYQIPAILRGLISYPTLENLTLPIGLPIQVIGLSLFEEKQNFETFNHLSYQHDLQRF